MPQPTNVQMKLAFLKQLQKNCRTTADIDRCVEDQGVMLNIKKPNETKTALLSKVADELQDYVDRHDGELREIGQLLGEIHNGKRTPKISPQEMHAKKIALKQKTKRLSVDTAANGERLIDTAVDLSAEHLPFRDMVAISGVKFRTVVQLTDGNVLKIPPNLSDDNPDWVLASADTQDSDIRAVAEYFISFGHSAEDHRKKGKFQTDLTKLAHEEIAILFDADIRFLEDDQGDEEITITPAFTQALETRIRELEDLAPHELAQQEKLALQQEQTRTDSLKQLNGSEVFLQLVQRTSAIAKAPIHPKHLALLKKGTPLRSPDYAKDDPDAIAIEDPTIKAAKAKRKKTAAVFQKAKDKKFIDAPPSEQAIDDMSEYKEYSTANAVVTRLEEDQAKDQTAKAAKNFGVARYEFTDQRPGINRDYYIYNTVREKNRTIPTSLKDAALKQAIIKQTSDPQALLWQCLETLPQMVDKETHIIIPIAENGPYRRNMGQREHFILLHVVMQPNGNKTATIYDPKGGSSAFYNLQRIKKPIQKILEVEPTVVYTGDQWLGNEKFCGHYVVNYGCAIVENGGISVSWYQKNRIKFWASVTTLLLTIGWILFAAYTPAASATSLFFGLGDISALSGAAFYCAVGGLSAFVTMLIVPTVRLIEMLVNGLKDNGPPGAMNALREPTEKEIAKSSRSPTTVVNNSHNIEHNNPPLKDEEDEEEEFVLLDDDVQENKGLEKTKKTKQDDKATPTPADSVFKEQEFIWQLGDENPTAIKKFIHQAQLLYQQIDSSQQADKKPEFTDVMILPAQDDTAIAIHVEVDKILAKAAFDPELIIAWCNNNKSLQSQLNSLQSENLAKHAAVKLIIDTIRDIASKKSARNPYQICARSFEKQKFIAAIGVANDEDVINTFINQAMLLIHKQEKEGIPPNIRKENIRNILAGKILTKRHADINAWTLAVKKQLLIEAPLYPAEQTAVADLLGVVAEVLHNRQEEKEQKKQPQESVGAEEKRPKWFTSLLADEDQIIDEKRSKTEYKKLHIYPADDSDKSESLDQLSFNQEEKGDSIQLPETNIDTQIKIIIQKLLDTLAQSDFDITVFATNYMRMTNAVRTGIPITVSPDIARSECDLDEARRLLTLAETDIHRNETNPDKIRKVLIAKRNLAAADSMLNTSEEKNTGVAIPTVMSIFHPDSESEEFTDYANVKYTDTVAIRERQQVYAKIERDAAKQLQAQQETASIALPTDLEDFLRDLNQLLKLCTVRFKHEQLKKPLKNEHSHLDTDKQLELLLALSPETHAAFCSITESKLNRILSILQKAGAIKTESSLTAFLSLITIRRNQLISQTGHIPNTHLPAEPSPLLKMLYQTLESLAIAGLLVMTGLGIFTSSIGFGLAQSNGLLIYGMLATPWFTITLAVVGLAFITQYFIRKIKFSVPETPLYKTITTADKTIEILERVTSVENSSFGQPNSQKVKADKKLLNSALVEPIKDAIKALDARYSGNKNMSHLIHYGTEFTANNCFNELELQPRVREDLDRLYVAQDMLQKNRTPDTATIQYLTEIFKRLQKAEIDPTHKPPYSSNRKINTAAKIGLPMLSVGSMVFCIYTLFSIFTGAAWIGGVAGMAWSMSLAAGLGFLSWITARSVLNHTSTGPFGEFAAIFAPFAIATIFILKAGGVAALGSWFAAFAIPALLFVPAVIAAIFYNRKNKTGKQNTRNSFTYQLSTVSLLALKIALIIGFTLLTFLSMASIFNLYGLSSFGGIDHVVGFAFDRIVEALGLGGFEVGIQWLSAFSIGIFATASFAVLMLLKDVLQISPTSANDKGILTRFIARILNVHIDKVEKITKPITKSMAQIIKLGFIVGMIIGFWELAKSGAFVAGASTELFLPFLIVAAVMPLLSGNANVTFLPKRLNNIYNTLFGVIPFHGKNKWQKYVGRELGILVLLVLVSIAPWIIVGSTTNVAIILGVSISVTSFFRLQRIVSDRYNPTALVQSLPWQASKIEKVQSVTIDEDPEDNEESEHLLADAKDTGEQTIENDLPFTLLKNEEREEESELLLASAVAEDEIDGERQEAKNNSLPTNEKEDKNSERFLFIDEIDDDAEEEKAEKDIKSKSGSPKKELTHEEILVAVDSMDEKEMQRAGVEDPAERKAGLKRDFKDIEHVTDRRLKQDMKKVFRSIGEITPVDLKELERKMIGIKAELKATKDKYPIKKLSGNDILEGRELTDEEVAFNKSQHDKIDRESYAAVLNALPEKIKDSFLSIIGISHNIGRRAIYNAFKAHLAGNNSPNKFSIDLDATAKKKALKEVLEMDPALMTFEHSAKLHFIAERFIDIVWEGADQGRNLFQVNVFQEVTKEVCGDKNNNRRQIKEDRLNRSEQLDELTKKLRVLEKMEKFESKGTPTTTAPDTSMTPNTSLETLKKEKEEINKKLRQLAMPEAREDEILTGTQAANFGLDDNVENIQRRKNSLETEIRSLTQALDPIDSRENERQTRADRRLEEQVRSLYSSFSSFFRQFGHKKNEKGDEKRKSASSNPSSGFYPL